MTEEISIKQDIETAAKILRDAGAQEIYVFGSASRGMERPGSDIDLAVRGLAPEIFYETAGRLLSALSRGVDLIDLDDGNEFAEYLERNGELKRVA